MFQLGNVSMDNSGFSHFPLTESSTDPEWGQSWQETEPQQQQAGTFAGLFANTHAAQQAQMSLPAATAQIPEQRQLDDLNVAQHPAAQHLPPAPSSQHAFQLLETYQPIFFEEQSSFDHSSAYDQCSAIIQFGQPIGSNPSELWEDIEQVMKDLNEDYVLVQPDQSTPPPRTITHSVLEDEIDTSDKHSKNTPPEAVKRPRKGLRTSARIRASTDASAPPTSKKGAESETSNQPVSKSDIVPSVVPLTVAGNIVQPQSEDCKVLPDFLAWADEYIIDTGSRVKRFKCGFERCGKTFAAKQVVKKHIFTHRRFSTCECPHPSCANNDKLRYHRDSTCLRRHIRTRHKKERPYYPCYFCTRIFVRSDHARNHMKNLHCEWFDKWPNEQGRSSGK